jgi:hypothetical protein
MIKKLCVDPKSDEQDEFVKVAHPKNLCIKSFEKM